MVGKVGEKPRFAFYILLVNCSPLAVCFLEKKNCCMSLVHKSNDCDGLTGRENVRLIEAKSDTLYTQYSYFK